MSASAVRLIRGDWQRSATVLFVAAIAVVFVAIWHSVLLGDRVLIGGDVLYGYPPWSGSPQAHSATNWLTADVVRAFFPWHTLERQAIGSGHLPLWDPFMLGGKPLLANYQSAFFSPFTWIGLLVAGARGDSLAMLAKLVVAGLGMYTFLRMLRLRPLAASVGALCFATCSYIVVWLGWPNSSVAVLIPWVFWSVEGFIKRPSLLGAVAVAATIALQFLAGHPESSIILAEGLAIYIAFRYLERRPGRAISLAGLLLSMLLGAGLAGVQLVAFAGQYGQTTLSSFHPSAGAFHLSLSELTSWLAPNLHGNPGIDGLTGRPPHYNASTGFIGVGAIVLAVVGAAVRGTETRLAQWAFVVMAVIGLGIAYGPLTWLVAPLPILSATNSAYAILLVCFSGTCLAGFGLQVLVERSQRRALAGDVFVVLGWVGLAGVVALAAMFAVLRSRAETLIPNLPAFLHSGFGFWALMGAASLLAAVGFTAASWLRGGGSAITGLLALVLIEAALFAGPYPPQVRPNDAPPQSAALSWLQRHAAGRPVAPIGVGTLIPETAVLYGLSDVRGYDVLQPPGVKPYWSLADPGYYNDGLNVWLFRPKADWLAAAGVGYVINPGPDPLAGTTVAYQGEGVTISEVPNARPFAFGAGSVECAPDQNGAAMMLGRSGPMGPVVLQSANCPAASSASVRIGQRQPERIEISVVATQPAVLVLLQSFTPDWIARIDGKPAQLMPADIQFQALAIPAGTHQVIVTYSPQSVRLGVLVTVAALIACATLFALAIAQRKRRRNHD